jgi:hypothetical protein
MPKSYKPEKTGMVVWAGYTKLGLTVFGSYRKRPHKGTMKWLLNESFKFPVIVSNMGKDQVLYVQGAKIEQYSRDENVQMDPSTGVNPIVER